MTLPDLFDFIEKRFGQPVTYEDSWPPAPFMSDVDSAKVVGGDVSAALGEALEAYRLAGGKGLFRVEERPHLWHIVGVGTRANDHQHLLREPPLDTQVHLVERQRTGLELLDDLTEAVSANVGVRVTPGTVPVNLLAQHSVRPFSTETQAREILRRLRSELPRQTSWRLFFDTQQRLGALNIHLIN